jgi:2,3-bisphosphoglycerate-independent phosphoglycerate mutase
MRVLEIFVDGFGLGIEDPEINPLVAARTPVLDKLLDGHRLCGTDKLRTSQAALIPLDAALDMPGFPQSATGQTTLWTGVNGAKAAGRHINAYPTTELRQVITERSIFKRLISEGYTATFANAFSPQYFNLVEEGKLKLSTSTLTALAGGVELRNLDQLKKGLSVYQDITNQLLIERGEGVPLYSGRQAGKHLAEIAKEYDFTLFEYFQTDRAGHKQDLTKGKELVELLDEFLGAVLEYLPLQNTLVILTSDHGNLEDVRTKGHTLNPVPCLLLGNYENLPYQGLNSIEQLAEFVLQVVREH